MAWFRKGRKKHRITKKDISEPTEFKHCFHAVLDASSRELEGLPPQWSEIVESQQHQEQNVNAAGDTSEKDSKPIGVGGIKPRPDTPHHSDFSNSEKEGPVKDSDVFTPSGEVDNCNIDLSRNNAKLINTSNRNSKSIMESAAVNLKENNARNLSSSSKHALAGTNNNSMGLSKRPSPIVRGSDASMEGTIRCIRKQSQHRSDENFPEETLNKSITGGGDAAVGRGRSHGRSRTGSFMQLRSSPVVRKHVVSYTSGTTSVTPHPSDRLPPSNFCLSAPSEVIQSDLGLYDGTSGSDLESDLYKCRINSPNGSSGYFGSSGSSLYGSRLSSTQQLSYSSQHSQPHPPPTPLSAHGNMSTLPSSPRDGDRHQAHHHAHHHNEASSVTNTAGTSHSTHHPIVSHTSSSSSSAALQHHGHHHTHHHPQQPWSSLHRRLDFSSSSSGSSGTIGSHAHHYQQWYGTSSSQGSSSSSSSSGGGLVRSGYGTAPRPHRPHYSSQATAAALALQCSEMDQIKESSTNGNGDTVATKKMSFQDQKLPFAPCNYPLTASMSRTGDLSAPPLSPIDSSAWHPGRRDFRRHHRSSSAGNYDHFRATLELLVSPGDPRGKYTDFRKIGEGSTGLVFTARDVVTGETVAVKKMNLWRQQRRELLFNEVI